MRWQGLIAVPVILAAGYAAASSSAAPLTEPAAAAEEAVTTTAGAVGIVPGTPAPGTPPRGPAAAPAGIPTDPLAQFPPDVTVPPGQPSPVLAAEGPLAVPELVYYAYRAAEMQLQIDTPGCGLPWNLLAAVGRLESGHAEGGRTDVLGTLSTPKVSPNGELGPMQLPAAVWEQYAVDGNADGRTDPQNVFDQSLAAGHWMCANEANLREPEGRARAIALFDPRPEYRVNVEAWSAAYEKGAATSPGVITPPPMPTTTVRPVPDAADVAAPEPVAPQPVASQPVVVEEPAAEPAPAEAAPAPEAPAPAPPALPEIPCLVPALCQQ
ncbi:hypothetical protein I0Q12_01160 [Rhodococcus sp. CX]|uniref:hypothetical protein n=1 Tax=Rhodococcus sp. CX TaxID=2789880 RepID=UPI0018CFCBAE|nr:hypothetical protein [Rhodococcus sp. CX]MBH0118217.1 hypothetical protein [Rhodococcus sp. CX]